MTASSNDPGWFAGYGLVGGYLCKTSGTSRWAARIALHNYRHFPFQKGPLICCPRNSSPCRGANNETNRIDTGKAVVHVDVGWQQRGLAAQMEKEPKLKPPKSDSVCRFVRKATQPDLRCKGGIYHGILFAVQLHYHLVLYAYSHLRSSDPSHIWPATANRQQCQDKRQSTVDLELPLQHLLHMLTLLQRSVAGCQTQSFEDQYSLFSVKHLPKIDSYTNVPWNSAATSSSDVCNHQLSQLHRGQG